MLKSLWANFYVKNLVIALGVVILGVIAVLLWLDSYTRHNQALIVPDVRGITVDQAIPHLESKSLRYEVIDSVFARDKAPGVIIEQIPSAESKVKEGRIVFLVVNATSTQMVDMPDVIDNSQRQAEASLQSLGFKIAQISIVPSEWKGLVLEVRSGGRIVKSGQKLPYGSSLVLYVGGDVDVDSLMVDPNLPTKPAEVPKNEESWF